MNQPKVIHLVPDTPRWPSIRWERGEGLLISLPSLHRRAIYVSAYVRPGRRSHIGWGRQFCGRGQEPGWGRYVWWGSH
jgi:hypothetical protein